MAERDTDEALMLAPCGRSEALPRISAAVRADPERLCDLLRAAGLAPLWSAWAQGAGAAHALPHEFRAWLEREHLHAAAGYLLQRLAAAEATGALAAAGVTCALFKGSAIRERLYPSPADRPAADLDLLVAAGERDRAVRVLAAQGFRLRANRATLSHEVSLVRRHVDLDLHWRLFRPGRSRLDLVPALLVRTHRVGGLPLLDDDANLLVMLVHPAFAKHVCGRAARLIQVVDMDRMLRAIQPDWDWILSRIDAAGLRVAAWAVLYRLRALMDTPIDAAVIRHLAPGRLQGRYLRFWIDRRLPARLGGIPGLVQGAFTLALHERASDSLRAVVRRMLAHVQSARTLEHLQRLGAGPADARHQVV